VVTREADLVTAHELGHNWGRYLCLELYFLHLILYFIYIYYISCSFSEHDPDLPECSPPASQGGSYLMYTYSVSGYDVNNKVVFIISTFIDTDTGLSLIFSNYRNFHRALCVPFGPFF